MGFWKGDRWHPGGVTRRASVEYLQHVYLLEYSPAREIQNIYREQLHVAIRRPRFTLLLVTTHTDRIYQVYAHMAFIGHPVICEQKYNFLNFEEPLRGPLQLIHFMQLGGQRSGTAAISSPAACAVRILQCVV